MNRRARQSDGRSAADCLGTQDQVADHRARIPVVASAALNLHPRRPPVMVEPTQKPVERWRTGIPGAKFHDHLDRIDPAMADVFASTHQLHEVDIGCTVFQQYRSNRPLSLRCPIPNISLGKGLGVQMTSMNLRL